MTRRLRIKPRLPLLALVLMGAMLGACGRYPETPQVPEVHDSGVSADAGPAERSGRGYVPAFLEPGYKTIDVTFDIKETIADIGGGYKYRALTYDGSFPAKTLVVEQGTLVRFKVTNSDDEPHTLHTHVIKYKPESDGSGRDGVEPGETRYFFWEVTNGTPPGFYPFHDHGGDGEGAQARGLIGLVSVVRPGEKAKSGFGILLHDIDGNFLFSTSGAPVMTGGEGGHGGGHGGGSSGMGMMPAHLINGKFGEAPSNTFEATRGSKVRVGVVNLGADIHTFHPHGNFFTEENGRVNDNLELQPGGYRTVDLNADAPGTWLYHCHVPGHPEGGMWGKYVVK